MIAFLKSGVLPLPRAVSAPPAPDAGEVGFIVPSFAEGSLLLKNKDGAYFRLAWEESAPQRPAGSATDRRRALPPGDYTVTGYRILRRDAQGNDWFISATARDLRSVTVRAGEEQQVKVDEAIHMECRPSATKGSVRIQMSIQGEHKSGLSIYQGGKRIPIQYRVAGRQGQELASGTMKYG